MHALILDVFLETEEEKEEARKKMAACLLPPAEEEDDDSDMEELLEQLEDLDNQGDPEIQQAKKKIKQKKKLSAVPKRKAEAKAAPTRKPKRKGILKLSKKARVGHLGLSGGLGG